MNLKNVKKSKIKIMNCQIKFILFVKQRYNYIISKKKQTAMY